MGGGGRTEREGVKSNASNMIFEKEECLRRMSGGKSEGVWERRKEGGYSS